jgi:hypothetical protein
MNHRRAVATVLGFLVILSAVLLSLTSVSPVAAAPYHQEPSGIQPLLTGCGLPGDVAGNDGQVAVADICVIQLNGPTVWRRQKHGGSACGKLCA